MKKFIYLFIYLFICVLIYSCKAQVIELDIKKQDIIVLNFTNGKIKLIVRNNIYSKDNLIVTSWIWAPEDMGKYYFEKNITFIQNKDTMNINYYGQGENLYLKSLQFKKGNYKLSFKKPTEKIIGSKIKNLKGVQNFLFKNAYVSPKKPVFQNVYFKNIEFHGVDLKDTINVKLVRIELLEKK